MDYEIKANYRFNGELTDEKFNIAILSVLDYANKQVVKMKPNVVFKHYDKYAEARKYIYYHLQPDNLLYHTVSKWSLVSYAIDMIICMPTPNMRKKVLNYLNSQITAYCYSERPYSNQIQGYPYKSKNIVDLLEEVEQVRQIMYKSGHSSLYRKGI